MVMAGVYNRTMLNGGQALFAMTPEIRHIFGYKSGVGPERYRNQVRDGSEAARVLIAGQTIAVAPCNNKENWHWRR